MSDEPEWHDVADGDGKYPNTLNGTKRPKDDHDEVAGEGGGEALVSTRTSFGPIGSHEPLVDRVATEDRHERRGHQQVIP